MKKKAVLIILVASLGFLSAHSQERPTSGLVKNVAVNKFNQLTIKSDITIMLIEDEQLDSIRIEGTKKFVEKVMILQADRQLIVRARSFKDLKKKGMVYIPVHALKTIEINAAAKVISFNTLQSPVLNILINGNCTVDIALSGRLNIRESDGYASAIRRVYENKTTSVSNQNHND